MRAEVLYQWAKQADGEVTDRARQHYLQQIINLPRLSIFFFLVQLPGLWDLSFQNRDEPYFRGSEVRAQSTKHWTTRGIPRSPFFKKKKLKSL